MIHVDLIIFKSQAPLPKLYCLKKLSTRFNTMRLKFYLLFLCMGSIGLLHAQLSLSTSSTENAVCDGFGCEYNGPSILINEVCIRPVTGDGSIYGVEPGSSSSTRQGEWIELYNPDLCKSVDISCYFLGNCSPEGNPVQYYGGGFELPAGTVVPSRGFVIVRGVNAPAVPSNLLVQNGGRTIEVVITNTPSVCVGGAYRLWFPNAGGWYAFYDRDGVPQDAIRWNQPNALALAGSPCNPDGSCPFTDTLASWNNIPANRKTNIHTGQPSMGQSVRRVPDGGNWVINATAGSTYGNCNSTCAPPPVVTCTGQASVTVTGGTPPYTYAWDDGALQDLPTAVGLCGGIYCVTVTDAAGITATACITVDDHKPAVAIPSFPDMCIDASPLLLAGGMPAGGYYSGPGVTANTFDPVSAGTGTHFIKYTYYGEDSCFNADSTEIQVHPLPAVVLPGFQDICLSAAPLLLDTGTPAGGTYSGPGVVGASFDPSLTGTGTFSITYTFTDIHGCTNSSQQNITVNDAPVVTIQNFSDLCANAPQLILTGGSPAGGTYSGIGVIGGYFNPALGGTGTYSIAYTYLAANGCSSTASTNLHVLPLPDVQLPTLPDVCINSLPILLTGGIPAGGTFAGPGIVANQFDPALTGVGTFNISYWYSDLNNCTDTAYQNIVVRPLPVVTHSSFAGICIDGEPFTLSGGSPAGGTYTGTGIYGGVLYPDSTGTGTFSVTYTYQDQYGCENDTTEPFTVHPLPLAFQVGGGGTSCQDVGSPVTLDSSQVGVEYRLILNGSFTGFPFSGTGDSISFGHQYVQGSYTIYAINTTTGCHNSMQGSTEVILIPLPVLDLGDSLYLCEVTEIVLDAGNFEDSLTYLWQDGSNSQTFIVAEPGSYWVKVGKGSCFATDTVQVANCSKLDVPNVFTPNGDMLNDRFKPKPFGDIYNYKVDVYSRWGKQVYSSTDLEEGWDGSINNEGSACSEGTYFFIITYTSLALPKPPINSKVTGSVTLLR